MADTYESDWDESYDDYYARQQQAQERQAYEAAMHARGANTDTRGTGQMLSASQMMTGMYGPNREAEKYAAREAWEAQQAASRRMYDDTRRQQQFEKRAIQEEAARRKFDSGTQRHLGVYAEDTKREHSKNVTGAMNNATNAMASVMGNLAGGAQNTPGMNLYGAGGQRIGGGGFSPGKSPLSGLLG